MKIHVLLCTLCAVLTAVVQAHAAAGGQGQGKNTSQDIEKALSAVSAAELPAKAADLVSNAKKTDKEDVALAAVQYVANNRPASITPVLSSVITAFPDSAPDLASLAAKLVPTEAAAIARAAMAAAPSLADKITAAVNAVAPGTIQNPGNPNPGGDKGGRPTVPPGLADGTKPGSIRGNRPAIPPGHVYDAKPGRDPQRDRYATP